MTARNPGGAGETYGIVPPWSTLLRLSNAAGSRVSIYLIIVIPIAASIVTALAPLALIPLIVSSADISSADLISKAYWDDLFAVLSEMRFPGEIPSRLKALYIGAICFITAKGLFDFFCPRKIKQYATLPVYLQTVAQQAADVEKLKLIHRDERINRRSARLYSDLALLSRDPSEQADVSKAVASAFERTRLARPAFQKFHNEVAKDPENTWLRDDKERRPLIRFGIFALFVLSLGIWFFVVAIWTPYLVLSA